MITDPKVLAAVREILPKSKHGCTTPKCLQHDYNIHHNTAEIVATSAYFNITHEKAITLLTELKLIYLKHGLDWDATSKAIKKL